MEAYNLDNAVNQIVVRNNTEEKFFSYGSLIVKIKNQKVYLDTNYWKCSRTTIKYRNKFLCSTSKEIEEKIKSGEYKLKNLNK